VKSVQASGRLLAMLGLATAAAAVALVWDGTRYPGPGLYGDGAGYLGAAQSLAHHGTLRVPFATYDSADSTSVLAQWPPGFPVVLSVPLLAGAGPMAAIRIVQAAVGGCMVALTAIIVATATAPAWGAAVAVVLLVTPSIVAVHLNVVSEPLYLLCLAIMLWSMVWRPGRPLMYGFAAAAGVLVRYLGVGAIAAAGVWAAFQPGAGRVRARRVAIAIVPGLVVRALWGASIRWAGGAERPLHADHHVGTALRQLAGATAAWLAPWDLGTTTRVIPRGAQAVFKVILGVAIAATIVAEAKAWRDSRRGGAHQPSAKGDPGAGPFAEPDARLLAASTLLAACHVAALLAARLLYSDVAFYDRVLAPVHYLLAVAVVTLIASQWTSVRSSLRLGLAALGLVWVAGAAATTNQLVQIATTVGLDHASVAERRGPTIGWLREHAAGEPIYTNEPAKIFFHLNRDSRSLPWILDADTARTLERALRARRGVVAWFTGGTAASFVAADLLPRASTPAKLEAALPLRVVARDSDGVVWELDPRVAP
jgi:hypothetical protein